VALAISGWASPCFGVVGLAQAAASQQGEAATTTQAVSSAATLRARYAALSPRLEQSPFQQHLYLESVESPHALEGDIYALVDYPLSTVSGAFTSPAHWCDALILHLNVKYCHPMAAGKRTVLSVAIGRKYDQPLSEAHRVEFAYHVAASAADYMAVDLDADKGPLGTTQYRIELEAVGVDSRRTFLHLRYAYNYGLEGHLAMEAYLATSGRDKVGFTEVASQGDATPHLVGGLRGAVERNTMRYYLAIDAHLGALTAPAAQRFEDSLARWFAATERYARQLHEVDRDTYLAMKRREYLRQQTLQ